jgi:hypothetical protein
LDDDNFYKLLKSNGPSADDGTQAPVNGQTTDYWSVQSAAGLTIGQLYNFSDYNPSIGLSIGEGRGLWIRNDGLPHYATWGEDTLWKTRFYRGIGGTFGLIGESDENKWFDEGETPDWAKTPPSGSTPLEIKHPVTGETILAENAGISTVYEGRRFMARTPTRPSAIAASEVEDYNNFSLVVPAVDSSPLSFELATSRQEAIRAIVPRQGLIVLTDSSEWLVSGSGQQELITPNSIAARPLSAYGSSTIQPIELNNSILFLQKNGLIPRAIIGGEGSWNIINMSLLSSHFFSGASAVSWAFSENPWQVLWVVLDNGKFLSCTFIPEQEMLAWTEHESSGDGEVKSVAVIPVGYEDVVYFVVERDNKLYLERLASRVINDVVDAIFLDGAVTYDGRNTTTDTIVIIPGGVFTRFGSVSVLFDGGGVNVGALIRVHGTNAGGDDVTCLLKLVSWGGVQYTAQLLEDLDSSFDTLSVTEWSLCAKAVSGLGHLNGLEVYALVDGDVQGPFTGGASVVITENDERAFEVAHVGLQYNSDFVSLDVAQDRAREKNMAFVTVELEASRGGWVGQTLDDLTEVDTREVSDSYDTGVVRRLEQKAPVEGEWSRGGAVAFRQVDPLPTTILGIMREMALGGK